jgi:predicted ATPase
MTARRGAYGGVSDGSQFVIATHSPIILAYPGATIYACTEDGLTEIAYEDANAVRLTQSFLAARDRSLEQLLAD